LFAKQEARRRPYATKRIYGTLGIDESQKGLPDMEFMTELSPPEGLTKYRVMRLNDPIIGGLILQIVGVMKRLRWTLDGENTGFVMSQLNNLKGGVSELVGEIAEGFTYGFYLGELVWNTDGGDIVLVDIEPRYQPSLYAIDPNGYVEQRTTSGNAKIPYTKCLHHVILSENRNPYGLSPLRHLYKPYYYKISIEAAESIGADRDLSGLPVLKAPDEFDFTAADTESPHYDADVAATLSWAIDLVSNVRKDEQQGVVLPAGWELSLVRGENRSSLPTTEIINRYNTEMAMGLLEVFLSMASSSSRANMEIYLGNFLTACDSFASSIAASINTQVIKRICEYNGLAAAPRITFSPARTANLENLASFVARLVKQHVITPSDGLEKALLAIADLPLDEAGRRDFPD